MQDWQWEKEGKQLEQKLTALLGRFKGFRPPGAGLLWGVLLVLLLLGGSSSFYQVGTEERNNFV